ncbi:MAG: HAD family hydrolase [Endomicrobiia bacterium]
MKLNLKDYRLIFFDFDGVIANTEWKHFAAFNKVLKHYGIRISKDEYLKEYLAYDDKGCFKKIFLEKLKRNLSDDELKILINKKTKILMSKLKKGFEFYKDTIKFIEYTKKNFPEINFCIVSGALKKEIEYILKKLNLLDNFVIVVSSEDVKNGKPSPEPFVLAKKLCEKKLRQKFSCDKILVVEDSINGIKSALSVGFKVLAVAHTYSIKKLKQTKANFVVKNLDEIFK